MAKQSSVETTVDRDKLLRAAKLCAATSDQHSPITAYRSALVRLCVDGCDMTANNGSVGTRAVVSLEAKGDVVSFCVNARRLLDVVNRAPEGYLQLAWAGTDLRVSSGPGKMDVKIATSPAKDFPTPIFPADLPLVEREPLALLLKRVAPFTNPIGGGLKESVHFEPKAGKLAAWSTTGHVIAYDVSALPEGLNCSLHANVVDVFRSALDSTDHATVGCALGEQITVEANGAIVTARSQGPSSWDWLGMLKPATMKLTVDRHSLLDAVGCAALFCLPEKPNMNLVTTTAEGGLRVSSAGFSADGSASTVVDCEGDRQPFNIAVSWRYLRDALGGIDTDRVELAVSGEFDQLIVRPVGPEGQMYVISPMTNK